MGLGGENGWATAEKEPRTWWKVSACKVVHVKMGGRTVILQANQGRGVGPKEDAEIRDERTRCEEKLEDVFHVFWSHDGERMNDC